MKLFNPSNRSPNKVSERTTNAVFKPDDIITTTPLKEFLCDNITDISYNGQDFYVQDNEQGRRKVDIKMSNSDVINVIKQIANVTGKSFNYTTPILDVSFGNYRLNAVHWSIAKATKEGTITFALRYLSPKLVINSKNEDFATPPVYKFLLTIIEKQLSVLISGITGSGKTEFQKYLVSLISNYSKIVLIEDTYETFIKELFPNLDVSVWLSNDSSKTKTSLSQLIKGALRNNPDWLILAEVRGDEAADLVESISTGHPCITTIHANSAADSLSRLLLLSINRLKIDQSSIEKSLAYSLRIAVHLTKVFNPKLNKYIRYIEEIVEHSFQNNAIEVRSIYKASYKVNTNKFIYEYQPISDDLATTLDINPLWFVRGKNEK